MLKVSAGHIVHLVPLGLHLVLPEQEVLKIKDYIFMVPCLPTPSYYLKSNGTRTRLLERILTTIAVCLCQDEKYEEIKVGQHGESKIVRNSNVIVHNIGNKVYSEVFSVQRSAEC